MRYATLGVAQNVTCNATCKLWVVPLFKPINIDNEFTITFRNLEKNIFLKYMLNSLLRL